MSIRELKEAVWLANLELVKRNLVIYTWGNVSAIDREQGLVVIKPSGVDYGSMKPEDMVVLTLDGRQVEGKLRPSSDTPTHLELFKSFPAIGGVVHTHSKWATIWAQAGRGIPCYGTTHADYFDGPVPCTRPMTPEEISGEYERNTGSVIVEAFRATDPLDVSAVLVFQHGPFTWGESPEKAVENAVVLEEAAQMAAFTELCNPRIAPLQRDLLEKHFGRKHGKNAYYGQKEK